MAEDYCEHCDLPFSTCIHGRPPAPEPVKAPPKASPVRRRTASASGSASRTTAGSASAPAPVRTAPRRRTDKAEFKPVIVEVLQEAGGEQEADLVLAALEERLAEVLKPGDHETGPTGEVRWRTAARWARKELADDGLLVAPQPGVWALTAEGMRSL
ncbi:MAG: winged helix-turn-helix domain-containing protein [Nocardioides sp.]|uniref:winged helix-turn-helix domain-containing protein n=1 Tax=Nocardioides sp. TaxID=35761 RepID=UPI002622531F|nr:winged helix-turn-helix domain-containing protein [Nocardioides sp.]